MRKLIAQRSKIPPHSFFCQNEIDAAKVDALVDHLRNGGTVPPVVAAKYGDEYMPIDGHHRLSAAERLEMTSDAWTVSGEKFETLDEQCRIAGIKQRAEDLIVCGGVPAMKVAASPS